MNEKFLEFLDLNNQKIFIEAEATSSKMNNFIRKYNQKCSKSVTITDEGICLLGEVDKWGVELRIYFNNLDGFPAEWNNSKHKNRKYRSNEFSYRLDNNELIWFLFVNGYHIGYNNSRL